MSEPVVKISANLPESDLKVLRWLADQRGTTMTEVLRQAIKHEGYFREVTNNGGKVLTEDRAGNFREVFLR